MNRPWLTFDADGTPRVHIPLANGGDMSVACTFEGLAEFVDELRSGLTHKATDPEFQKQVGERVLKLVKRWWEK